MDYKPGTEIYWTDEFGTRSGVVLPTPAGPNNVWVVPDDGEPEERNGIRVDISLING